MADHNRYNDINLYLYGLPGTFNIILIELSPTFFAPVEMHSSLDNARSVIMAKIMFDTPMKINGK